MSNNRQFVLQDSAKSEIYAGRAFIGKSWKIMFKMTNYAKNSGAPKSPNDGFLLNTLFRLSSWALLDI